MTAILRIADDAIARGTFAAFAAQRRQYGGAELSQSTRSSWCPRVWSRQTRPDV
ncbi:MAG: hypothetical protein AAFY64_00525 [Pseudomonadota bacterium]